MRLHGLALALPLLLLACACQPANGVAQSTGSDLLSRPKFIQLYADRLRQHSPQAEIVVQSDDTILIRHQDQSTSTLYPDNIYATYLGDPGALDAILDRYSVSVAPPADVIDDQIDIANLVACVRTDDLSSLAPDPDNLTSEPIAGDLLIRYCVDSEKSTAFAHPDQMKDLIARHPDYRVRAIRNVRRVARAPEFTLGAGRAMVVNGGDYEASLILDDEVWLKLHEHLGGRIVFAVPTRDLFESVDGTRGDDVSWLREQVDLAFQTGPYPISDKLDVRDQSGISVYAE